MITPVLQKHIQNAVKSLGISVDEVHLEHPAEESHGDYSSNIAMTIFSKSKIQNSRELAQKIVDELHKDEELKQLVSRIEIAGPGFINFWLKEEYLYDVLRTIIVDTVQIPSYVLGSNKKVLVEFAHFNTHKAVHIGHMRNITLGESISRILERLGNTVVRVSYGGDVGMHIAKCLFSIRKQGINLKDAANMSLNEKTKLLANAYKTGNDAYEDDEESKKEIIEINKKIYQGDPETMSLWKETKKWSLDQFDRIYQRVNTTFDRLYYESEVFQRGLKLSQKALGKNILQKSEGAVVFDGKPFGLDTRVFITSEGNPTYEGKELGIAELEFRDYPDIDKCIHVVAPEQASFFAVTFKVEELLDPGKYMEKQYHFPYGYVRLTSGKMSSRKGTFVLGEWLLDEVVKKITEKFTNVSSSAAEIIAVGAVKYSFLKIDSRQDISFDIDESVSVEGNSGPYLQYTYARCKSVMSKSQTANSKQHTAKTPVQTLTHEELIILRTLYKFPEVVYDAGRIFSPNLICNYLYDIAQKYNLFYQKVSILNAENEEAKMFRLSLTNATAQVLKNGLTLLGIDVLEKM